MKKDLSVYKSDIMKVFNIGISVLNTARSLKSISLDLKLLAINGIVQAARLGDEKGKSLITLSDFLSDLPSQIEPELTDLEDLTSKLATEITISTIALQRLIMYSVSLENIINKNLESLDGFNIYSSGQLEKIESRNELQNTDEVLRGNIIYLAGVNLSLINKLNVLLRQSKTTISNSRNKMDRIRRNGFIANYMGSNISVESAYLSGSRQSFVGLVENITQMVSALNRSLDEIMERINHGDMLLSKLIKSGIIN